MPRPKTGETPKRNIRVPDATWLPAVARAEEEETKLAKIVNSRIDAYGRPLPDAAPEFDPWDVVRYLLTSTGEGKIDNPGEDLGLAMEVITDAMRVLGMRATRGDQK